MRILILTDRMGLGGAETHIITLARGLCDRGHRVVVASEGGELTQRLIEAGARHVRLPLASHRPTDILAAYAGIESIIRANGIELIHAHARIAALLGCAAAKRAGIPFVTTAHARFEAFGVRKLLSRWGTLTLAVGEDIKQYLVEEYSLDSDNIRVIPNGIELEKFEFRGKEHIGRELVFVSRMDADCSLGAELLCGIAGALASEFSDLKITLVGGGSEYARISRLAVRASERSGASVRAVGYVENISEILRRADAFVGVSRAAIEAMACGACVVLGGNEGFFGEVDENNFSFAMAENFCARSRAKMTARGLYSAVRRVLLMDEARKSERALAVRRLIEARFDAEEMVSLTENAYFEARGRAPSGRGDIVLCGYYGYGNLGDDALLKAAVARAKREMPDMKISALTRGGKIDSERFGVRCVCRKAPFAAAREIKGAQILVFGGGTLLQDGTSRRSLLYYTSVLRYAQKNGVRCELWGNGIGPVNSLESVRRICRTLRWCSYIGVRDRHSAMLAHRFLAHRGVTPNLEGDLAKDVISCNDSRADYLINRYFGGRDVKFVVVSVKGGGDREELLQIARAIKSAKARGLEVLFLEAFPKEDRAVTRRLCEAFGGALARGLSPSDAVGILRRAEYAVSSRFHTLVFANAAGIGFEGIGNDPKIKGFCFETPAFLL